MLVFRVAPNEESSLVFASAEVNDCQECVARGSFCWLYWGVVCIGNFCCRCGSVRRRVMEKKEKAMGNTVILYL